MAVSASKAWGCSASHVTGMSSRPTPSSVEKPAPSSALFTRIVTHLTNAFSKRQENLKASVGLFYAYYNFVKINGSIRMTPALKAGVTNHLWTLSELMDEADAHLC